METYTTIELTEILEQHKLWLSDNTKGRRANLGYADLGSSHLGSANLESANLRSADLRHADLRSANLGSANLRYADLRFADLRSADLRSANLRYATGNGKEVKTIQSGKYHIVVCGNNVSIGCQSHKWDQWIEFNDSQINDMDNGALEWWVIWRPIIQTIIDEK